MSLKFKHYYFLCVISFFALLNCLSTFSAETKLLRFCENEWRVNPLSCSGRTLEIKRLKYHRPSTKTCVHPYANANRLCVGKDYSARAKSLIQDGVLRWTAPPNEVLGEDPCPNIYKQIDIEYECLGPIQPPLQKQVLSEHALVQSRNETSVSLDSPLLKSKAILVGLAQLNGKEVRTERLPEAYWSQPSYLLLKGQGLLELKASSHQAAGVDCGMDVPQSSFFLPSGAKLRGFPAPSQPKLGNQSPFKEGLVFSGLGMKNVSVTWLEPKKLKDAIPKVCKVPLDKSYSEKNSYFQGPDGINILHIKHELDQSSPASREGNVPFSRDCIKGFVKSGKCPTLFSGQGRDGEGNEIIDSYLGALVLRSTDKPSQKPETWYLFEKTGHEYSGVLGIFFQQHSDPVQSFLFRGGC
jgi:hypothetical protein